MKDRKDNGCLSQYFCCFFWKASQKKADYTIHTNDLRIIRTESLGAGAYSDVVKGWHKDKPVAVKRIAYSGSKTQACEKEKLILEKIGEFKIRNVVTYYGCLITHTHYHFVTKLVTAGSLITNYKQKPISWGLRLGIIKGITEAISDLHDYKIVHRDIKPSNILLEFSNNAVKPMLTDFGLAKIMDAKCKLVGTALYIAPEIIEAKTPYTEKADIFSWGATIRSIAAWSEVIPDSKSYDYMLQVKAGFREPIPEGIPPKVAHMITWCWDQDPNNRPTAKELLAKVGEAEEELGENAPLSEEFKKSPNYGTM